MKHYKVFYLTENNLMSAYNLYIGTTDFNLTFLLSTVLCIIFKTVSFCDNIVPLHLALRTGFTALLLNLVPSS